MYNYMRIQKLIKFDSLILYQFFLFVETSKENLIR
jgi:hypothetical protein